LVFIAFGEVSTLGDAKKETIVDGIEKEIFGIKCYDMEPVYEKIEAVPTTVRNKPFMATLYIRRGLARYIKADGREFISDNTTIRSDGPDGVSTTCQIVPEVMPTPEECAEGRRRLSEITTQCMTRQGYW
jgi:hypothetical protein